MYSMPAVDSFSYDLEQLDPKKIFLLPNNLALYIAASGLGLFIISTRQCTHETMVAHHVAKCGQWCNRAQKHLPIYYKTYDPSDMWNWLSNHYGDY